MSPRRAPRILSIPPGVPFLPTLRDALCDGRLVPGFRFDGDPLALADVTIYLPTRRAARELRAAFLENGGASSVLLPTIRPLGEFDEDAALFSAGGAAAALDPPVSPLERLLLLAPLVRSWKARLPAHVAGLFSEEIVVPASSADAVWLARDLAELIDEVETEGAQWSALQDLIVGELAAWWQVTVEFLQIAARHFPRMLEERRLSSPAGHRNAVLRAEARRLRENPPPGPVIAAGSTGSIPATAELLREIARLPHGAVVLPGLDRGMDERSWQVVADIAPEPAVLGHPQYGLARLLRGIGVERRDVEEVAQAAPLLRSRAAIVSEAFRPAATTDGWAERRAALLPAEIGNAFAGVALVEAAHERDEAAAIALALRRAVGAPGRTAALLTPDRDLARRVSAELLRFGIRADDSGGTPLASTPPAALLRQMLAAVFAPGDPVPILALLKHPLLTLGLERLRVRRAVDVIELVALRGAAGRATAGGLAQLFEAGLARRAADTRPPPWFRRLSAEAIADARLVAERLGQALAGLLEHAAAPSVEVGAMARRTTAALEALARDGEGGVEALYDGDAGESLAGLLRELVASRAGYDCAASEWPDVLEALLGATLVKPTQGSDPRVFIWGTLEARLLSPDTLVVGGLNEGSWPRQAQSGRFMSRFMKSGMALEPPERRIGQAAHDFQMALGVENLVLTRAQRSGDAPSTASRWLQRILTFAGEDAAEAARARGQVLIDWARALDAAPPVPLATRPVPAPPLALRPKRFSVTEIETLRRDPYAVYARRILGLEPLEPLLRDPGAAERGTLFHDIFRRFVAAGRHPDRAAALAALHGAGRAAFALAALPPDVHAVWWPRFEKLALEFVDWDLRRDGELLERLAELRAEPTFVGASGVQLSGYADRIDRRRDGGFDILDYKTGSSPTRRQAHRLIAPQLALEGALLRRGAFGHIGAGEPAGLAYVRLRPNGAVLEESILAIRGSSLTARDLSDKAWVKLEELLAFYARPESGYRSRALPFREADEGDYDHLARVLEWSAGGDDGDGDGDGG